MLKKTKDNFIELFNNKKYMTILIIVTILSFGLLITKSGSVNMDALSYDRYFFGNELLAQKRFGAVLIENIFHIYTFGAYFMDTLGALFFFFTSILMSSFFKTVSKNKLSNTSLTIFSALFVSYPLAAEIFSYSPAGTNIGLCYILTTLSIILAYNYFNEKKKIKFMLSSLPLLLAIALYESFACVYLLFVFIILILEENNKKHHFLDIFLNGVMLLIPLFIAVMLNIIISEIIVWAMDLTISSNAVKTILYLNYPIGMVLKHLVASVWEKYFAQGFIYFPIGIFSISCYLSLIISIISSIIKKNYNYLILYFGLFISVISLSLLRGTFCPYRTCQTFAPFVGFIFMITINSLKELKVHKIIYCTGLVIMAYLIFEQCYHLNNYFYINYLRYEEEKQVMINVGNDLQANYDTSKPIIVRGSYELSKNIQERIIIDDTDSLKYKLYALLSPYNFSPIQIGEFYVSSYISWGIQAFGEQGTELNKWWKYLGYDFTMAKKDDCTTVALNNETYPKKGYIIETDDYIIVNF